MFLFPPEVHERFLIAVLPFLLLAATTSVSRASPSRTMLVAAVAIVSVSLLFNLWTIAQPYFVTPFNLVAQSTTSDAMRALAVAARAVAVINLLVFGGLMWCLWSDAATGGAATSLRQATWMPHFTIPSQLTINIVANIDDSGRRTKVRSTRATTQVSSMAGVSAAPERC